MIQGLRRYSYRKEILSETDYESEPYQKEVGMMDV